MDIHEALLKLRHSKEKDMIPDDAFLAHAFVMRDEQGGEEWQIGYYSPSSMLMTSFMIGETITMLPPAEVLKTDVEIHELNPASVTITPVNAFHTAEKVVKEHYSGALAARVFYIIQHLEKPVLHHEAVQHDQRARGRRHWRGCAPQQREPGLHREGRGAAHTCTTEGTR